MQLSLAGSGQRDALSVVIITFSLPEHRAVVHLMKKIANAWSHPRVYQGGAGGLGKDILTSAIPLRQMCTCIYTSA